MVFEATEGLFVTQQKLTDILSTPQEFAVGPASCSFLRIQQSNVFLLFYIRNFTDSWTSSISKEQAASRAETSRLRRGTSVMEGAVFTFFNKRK